MSTPPPTDSHPSSIALDHLPDLVREADTGARNPSGLTARLIAFVSFTWALFQLWYASPLPFSTGFLVLNDSEARSIHLAFALFLSFMAYPAFRSSSRAYVPLADWTLSLVGAFCAIYIYLYYPQISNRPGIPSPADLWVSGIGVLLLLEAARRSLGAPLMIVAIAALIYTLFGYFMPDVIAHKGASLRKMLGHQWLSTEGVYGIALGVSANFVFLFVLFGALLDRGGAGNFFIKLSFSLLGHFRGGPAKAAVVASGLTGLISGSSVANVVTTGTFTIPLMKRVGFSALKAGALEAATGINGQIMPPVMGAAAFLMVEYVGISYGEICKHAFLPAILSYIALLYTVHLEAVSQNMRVLKRSSTSTIKQSLLNAGLSVSALISFCCVVYFGISFLHTHLGAVANPLIGLLLITLYAGLVWLGASSTALDEGMSDADYQCTPPAGPILRAGLYYLLPVFILVWCLMVERLSPGLSAFWATLSLIFMTLTHRPMTAFFRGQGNLKHHVLEGIKNLYEGMLAGSRNMICIAIATATAGIIVGTVSLTGIGLKLTAVVELLSGGNLFLVLTLTALISLVLGMGLPTTANYIVVSTLMAPVLVELGAETGLIVPLISVHLFVFYFGIMADVTPPVGLASFAASAISGADPMKTGAVAFFYSLRTVALPFIFIYNPKVLLIGVETLPDLILTVVGSTIAMLAFVSAMKGYFITHSRLYEGALMLAVSFIFFRPDYLMDMVQKPFESVPISTLSTVVTDYAENASLRIQTRGETIIGEISEKVVLLPLGPQASSKKRLDHAGLKVREKEGKVIIDHVRFGSPADKAGLKFDWEITDITVPTNRPPQELMFIPGLLILLLVTFLQITRRKRFALGYAHV